MNTFDNLKKDLKNKINKTRKNYFPNEKDRKQIAKNIKRRKAISDNPIKTNIK